MIVTCPNCGARYRLTQPVAPGARMRCAECQHRWTPEDEAPDAVEPGAPSPGDTGIPPGDTAIPPGDTAMPPGDTAIPLGGAEMPLGDAAMPPARPAAARADDPGEAAAAASAAPPAAPPSIDADRHDAVRDPVPADEPAEPPRSRILASLAAIVAGLALAAVAAGLWIGDRLPELASRLPGLAVLADAAPPLPVTLTARGVTASLPSGRAVLEVTGTIVNPTPRALPVPGLAATLSGPAGVALRWTIAPPAPRLPARSQVIYTATVTGFPADATTLTVTALR